MISFSKKFNLTSPTGGDVLSLPEIINNLSKKSGGEFYAKKLQNKEPIDCSFDLFVDGADVGVQFRGRYGVDTGLTEDLISGKVYPWVDGYISQIILDKATTGLIFFKFN